MKKLIGEAEILQALEILKKYKAEKAVLEERVISDEQWWKLRHSSSGGHRSAWLFNTIANKHADAMDNIPEAVLLPREEGDRRAAELLSAVVPVVLEQNEFENVYSEVWYDKLKHGTGCYGVFWNPEAAHGVGDIEIVRSDVLNLFWEGGIMDIQKSPNLFHVELWNNDELEEKYPFLKGILSNPDFEPSRYIYDDTVETSGKSAVIDWYYKKRRGGRSVVHLCKFCNGKLLFASENEAGYENGFYAHGKYPFVFDRLHVMQGSPCGFGYIDVLKDTQAEIDSIGAAVTENAKMASRVRYFVRNDGAVNEEEFADWRRPLVHVQGSKLGEDSLRQIVVSPLAPLYVSILNNKVDELKEVGGNRDFTQGGTTGGITAASAIAALQEAGSKLSRDMLKGTYSAFSKVVYLAVELMREFYTAPRFFRITEAGGEDRFISFSSGVIGERDQGSAFGVSLGRRAPVFDIKVKAQRQSPFAKVSQNELAKEFFSLGFFAPEAAPQALACISMMDFEGKDALCEKIKALAGFSRGADLIPGGGVKDGPVGFEENTGGASSGTSSGASYGKNSAARLLSSIASAAAARKEGER